jgi:hypothetical protein
MASPDMAGTFAIMIDVLVLIFLLLVFWVAFNRSSKGGKK